MLCDNKAPRIKRQVASIDKKSDLRWESSPIRTSTACRESSSKKKEQTMSKMVHSGNVTIPGRTVQSFKDAKLQPKPGHIGLKSGGGVDDKEQPS